jgi:CBS domain containing-hemolysin-like protein
MTDMTDSDQRTDGQTLAQALMARLRSLIRKKNGDGSSLRETLEELIEENEADDQQRAPAFSEEERAILLNALSFGELQLWDVMVPRSDIKTLDISSTLDDVIASMRESTHTRMPVVRETLDDVAGMVHLKDLLPFWGDGKHFKLKTVMRELLFVPPSMKVLDLLMKMRDTGTHMAIVVDEYGGTDGMVTIEDLVEEIVGEIQDEHDKILPPSLTERPDGTLEADARVEVEDLEKHLGLELLDEDRREDVDTLGGLIFTLLDRVPARGEIVPHPGGLEFEMLDADPRRVKRVLIRQRAASGKTSKEPSTASSA